LIKDSRHLLANYVSTAGIVQVGKGINSPYPTNYNNISPRAGFARDILGSGKTLLRGGGGIIFEQPSIRTFMFSGGGLNQSHHCGARSHSRKWFNQLISGELD
jgi:hypothetical protein